jgi:hypothetical protein
MWRFPRPVLATIVALSCASAALGQSPASETTDVYIRRLAGLPAETAKGQIEIIDVGHGALDTMLSIVGNRTEAGWAVSYACAMSPHCSSSADHMATTYTLSPSASAEIDRLLEKLKLGAEPDGRLPSPTFIGGQLLVSIDYEGPHGSARRPRHALRGLRPPRHRLQFLSYGQIS